MDHKLRRGKELLSLALAVFVVVMLLWANVHELPKSQVEAAGTGVSDGVRVEMVRYGSDARHRAFLCTPVDVSGRHKSVLLFHGGGGAIADMLPTCRRLAKSGYVAASADYRQEPYGYPVAVSDATRAFDWFAKLENVDTTKIGTWGGSAGGYLASMLGTVTPANGGLLYRPRCVVSRAGPTDWTAEDFRNKTLPNGKSVPDGMFGGVTYEQDPALYARASSAKHVTRDDGKFAYVRSVNDHLVPRSQLESLQAALNRVGKELRVMEYNGTGPGHANDVPPALAERIWDFQKGFMDGCLN